MRRLIALTLCFVGAACGSISKDYPQKTFYAFEVERPASARAADDAPILLVQRFRSGALSKGQGLVYRTGPSQYESDYYSEFFNEPEDLLTLVVAEWMDDSGLFSVSLGGSTEVEPEYVLQGSLRSLYVDQTVDGETRAVVDLQLFMSRRDRARSEPVWHGDFRSAELADSPSGLDVLDAWNRGLADMLASAEAELREALSATD
jgi:cholesterol transport system auxiliary component